ncbi:MAG: glycosyltransferase family 9 protein [Syntrophobacteraceae bacterium]
MKKICVPSSGFHKILIVKPSAFGDVLHGLPVLHALSLSFPQAQIHWVVAKPFAGILEGHPLLHRLWVIDKDGWKRPGRLRNTFWELRGLRRGLRGEKFDLVIDLQGLFRSAMIVYFTGVKESVGFESAREGARFFYRYRVRTGSELHAVEKNLEIAGFVGCRTAEPQFPLISFGEPPEFIERFGRYAVIAPSAATAVKRWPAQYFGRLAALLPLPSVIVGGPSDVGLGDEIASLSGGKAVSFAGKTSLRGLGAIIKGARFLVTCDSGPMHLGAALGVPVFSIFGPTSPLRTGPYGAIHTVIRRGLACSPCFTRKVCPDWRCMRDISPEMVLEAIASKGF